MVTTTATQPKNMVWVPGGDFLMGSEDFYPEERPVHTAHVGGFWMDAHPVTVAEFRRFVKATGHVTVAEIAPEAADFPDAAADQLVPGSLVFTPPGRRSASTTSGPGGRGSPALSGAIPRGPDSTLNGRELHPVTHVAYADALAYASWAGKELPTEPEWEFAARGGLEGAVYAWGDDVTPRGRQMANTWQGDFPLHNDAAGRLRAHVASRGVPAQRVRPGRHDRQRLGVDVPGLHEQPRRCGPVRARGQRPTAVVHHVARPTRTLRPRRGPRVPSALKVIKGGSHLCAPNYCLRYRPAARQSQTPDTSTSHLGFRCISRSETGRSD